MVLSLSRLSAVLLILAFVTLSIAPLVAHEDHKRREQAAQDAKVEASTGAVEARRVQTPGAMHEMMEDHAAAMEHQAPKTFSERLMSWLGRTHPFAVHFPIALFPVAFVALVLVRRRGETAELIRALIIAAGVSSTLAGALGWFTGGFVLVDTDPVQLWHRWIGTALAVLGGGLAVWALMRRSSVYSRGMVFALGALTLLLLVQGWLGAALVHGMNHMSF